MDEESQMFCRRPEYEVRCQQLPPEVLQIILSHLVTRNDYRSWIRMASVCSSFARCLELYMPFDDVEVGYCPQPATMFLANMFPARRISPSFPGISM